MTRSLSTSLAAILMLCTVAAQAADLSGKARVVDGETIEIGGQLVRLHGIAAPAPGALCDADGKSWHCGQEAAFALADTIGRAWVECDLHDAGSLDLRVGVCRVGGPKGRDLGAWMVTQGWARAGTDGYAKLEKAARTAGAGMWRQDAAQ